MGHEAFGTARRPALLLYGSAIFLSAFLVFQVQPMIGRYALPWFGGGAGVWTTVLLFFQVALLLGYGYAHLLATRLSVTRQVGVHVALLAAAALALPVIPTDGLAPGPGDDPTLGILLLLTATVGGPYLLLSSTAPLLQSWFARAHPGRSPYRFYALSNAGSMLALLSYPFVVEPTLRLDAQAWAWSAGYVAFAVLAAAAGRHAHRAAGTAPQVPTAVAPERSLRPSRRTVALWIALPAAASLLFLATTARITLDVAAVPLLWVLPLALYLLTFVIAFDAPRRYRRGVWVRATVAATAVLVLLLGGVWRPALLIEIAAYLVAMFAVVMTLHGEVARLAPDPDRLTSFYLMVASGGALGGVFAGVVAPLLLEGPWEFHIAVVASAVLVLVAVGGDAVRTAPSGARREAGLLTAIGAAGVVVVAAAVTAQGFDYARSTIFMERSFYGGLRVVEDRISGTGPQARSLLHGRIEHGLQFVAAADRARPTAYYGPASGVAIALNGHPVRDPAGGDGTLRIAAVGLGVGTVAAYAVGGDHVTFFELDPAVARIADRYFTFLGDAAGRGVDIDVVLGDARLSMERRITDGETEVYDVVILDAFNSDAVPVHLLTAEAFATYDRLLARGGIIAVHTSNRYVDFGRVVRRHADDRESTALRFVDGADPETGLYSSEWILITDDASFATAAATHDTFTPWTDEAAPVLWTDDFSDLLGLLEWAGR